MADIIVAVRGISEHISDNLLKNVRNKLERDRVQFVWIDFEYPATFGGRGPNYDIMRGQASDRLQSYVQSLVGAGQRVVVLGYSAGADVAGDAMSAPTWGAGGKVRLVGLVSDPKAPEGTGMRGRWGIAGLRPRNHPRAKWYSNPVDVICSCPPVSGWRKFYASVRGWSVMDPRAWSASLIAQAQLGNLRGAWSLDDVRLGRGYLYDGQHHVWYIRSGMLDRLVDDIKAALR